MGNVSQRQFAGSQLPPDPRSYIQYDLPKFQVLSKLGNGKFMKSFQMRVDGTTLVVKVYAKAPEEDLQQVAAKLSNTWRLLSPLRHPYFLPYQMWIKSNTKLPKSNYVPVFLIRQHLMSNLYDRLSTRPFFTEIEKLWMVYQLLKCMEVLHGYQIMHGDIKLENILVTSWNWLILTDFASFKPTQMPDDDPTDFQYYFDTMNRQRCAIAPERFYSRSTQPPADPSKFNLPNVGDKSPVSTSIKELDKELSDVLPTAPAADSNVSLSADLFSCGCAIAEIFLDAVPLFDLAALLRYISTNPEVPDFSLDHEKVLGTALASIKSMINRISIEVIRQLVVDMTKRDPLRRRSAREYLQLLRKQPLAPKAGEESSVPELPNGENWRILPPYFDSVMYPLFLKIQTQHSNVSSLQRNGNAAVNTSLNGLSPDDRIGVICQYYGKIVKHVGGYEDAVGAAFFGVLGRKNPSHRKSSAISRDVKESKDSDDDEEDRNETVDILSNLEYVDVDELIMKCKNLISSFEFTKENFINEYRESKSNNSVINDNEGDKESDLSYHLNDLVELSAIFDAHGPFTSYFETSIIEWYSISSGAHKSKSTNVKEALESLKLSQARRMSTLLKYRENSAGLLLIVQILCSNIRHVKMPQTRMIALSLLVRFGVCLSDTVIIQRVIPSVLNVMTEDSNSAVVALAIRCLSSLLYTVQNVSSFESNLFPLYILPALSSLSKSSELLVRVAFAESIGKFAEVAKRILDCAHCTTLNKTISDSVASGGSVSRTTEENLSANVLVESAYDSKLKTLHETIYRWIRDLVDSASVAAVGVNERVETGGGLSVCHGSSVKRALLSDVLRLCVFFGEANALEMLLLQLLAFLNDQDWELREALCQKIPCICAYLGANVTNDCILPCVDNALADVEERVVVAAVTCIRTLIELDLIRTSSIVECLKSSCSLLIHPGFSIREAAIDLVVGSAKLLGQVESLLYVYPQLKQFLRFDAGGVNISRETLQKSLVSPIPRLVYAQAVVEKAFGLNSSEAVAITNNPLHKGDYDNEQSKIESIKPYIARAASELSSKALLWSKYCGSVPGYNSDTARLTLATLGVADSSLNNVSRNRDSRGGQQKQPTYVNTHDIHSVQSLLVPNQKLGYIVGAPEEVRARAYDFKNMGTSQVKAVYGLMLSHVEAEKSLAMLGAFDGAVTTGSLNESTAVDTSVLAQRIKALNIPPLGPDLGVLFQPDGRRFNSFMESIDTSLSNDSAGAFGITGSAGPAAGPPGSGRSMWRPRENVLVCTLTEHAGSVNRLAVSQDHIYFVSASSDKTAKVWATKNLDRSAFPRSVATYSGHKDKILDVACIENSHGVVSCSADGAVHLWRVDVVSASTNSPSNALAYAGEGEMFSGLEYATPGAVASTIPAVRYAGSGNYISGLSVLRTVDVNQFGSVGNLTHFNTDISSLVVYSTALGGVHGWDIRTNKDAFQFPLRPELGSITALTASPDRNWLCFGTSDGYINLWDIRYNVSCKLWRHSSNSTIHRLATSHSMNDYRNGNQGQSKDFLSNTDGAYLFVGAGNNEISVFGIPEAGECFKCFRAVPMNAGKSRFVTELPKLVDIPLPRHPMNSVNNLPMNSRSRVSEEQSMRAMLGRISPGGNSFVVTAGTDKQIRYWDFVSPFRCFTVSGLDLGQQKSAYESPNVEGLQGKLVVSYDTTAPSSASLVQAHMPFWEGRGPVNPVNKYKDAILDLKMVDLPVRLLLSSGRDGAVKIWR